MTSIRLIGRYDNNYEIEKYIYCKIFKVVSVLEIRGFIGKKH